MMRTIPGAGSWWYRPVWVCSRAGRISFRWWRRTPHSCHEGTCPVPGRTRVACGWLPAGAMGDGLRILEPSIAGGVGVRFLMHFMVLGAFWHLEDDALPRCLCEVLMHLMALGAFEPPPAHASPTPRPAGLNTPYGARCFLTDGEE